MDVTANVTRFSLLQYDKQKQKKARPRTCQKCYLWKRKVEWKLSYKISDFLKIFSLTHSLIASGNRPGQKKCHPVLSTFRRFIFFENDVNLWRKLSKKKEKENVKQIWKVAILFFSQPHQCIHHIFFFGNGFQKHWIWKGWIIIMVAITLFDIRCANVIMSFEMFEWWCVTNIYFSIDDLKKWKKMKWKGCDKRREKWIKKENLDQI